MGNDREKQLALLVGAVLGAALMFILDPARGGRRRALVRDKSLKALRRGGEAIHERTEDIGNRLTGAVAELRGRGGSPPTDQQLAERVRAELGHKVEHAKAIEVFAEDGHVTLRGDVLREELDDVLSAVRGVHGVAKVRSEMSVRATPGDIPSLQS
ncbi:MAG TPA: BON domain-containing protein [Gemmatimonadaceae bacterium]|nr:BON domain-containing protein [Gemmatimonadaceae bacterium]